jgi:acyl-CoA synthetase (AMP-forming)/AMP-acid ligase II
VVAEPDPVLGEKTHAFVFAKAVLTGDDVKAFCRARLSDYKVPDFVTFVDQPLPRNANGKILKRALRTSIV